MEDLIEEKLDVSKYTSVYDASPSNIDFKFQLVKGQMYIVIRTINGPYDPSDFSVIVYTPGAVMMFLEYDKKTNQGTFLVGKFKRRFYIGSSLLKSIALLEE